MAYWVKPTIWTLAPWHHPSGLFQFRRSFPVWPFPRSHWCDPPPPPSSFPYSSWFLKAVEDSQGSRVPMRDSLPLKTGQVQGCSGILKAPQLLVATVISTLVTSCCSSPLSPSSSSSSFSPPSSGRWTLLTFQKIGSYCCCCCCREVSFYYSSTWKYEKMQQQQSNIPRWMLITIGSKPPPFWHTRLDRFFAFVQIRFIHLFTCLFIMKPQVAICQTDYIGASRICTFFASL